jgi:NitT/TauT family transport system permease protein
MPTTDVVDRPSQLDEELAGLDALERPVGTGRSFKARAWTAVWPKVAAIALALLLWQLVVWSGWRPEYVLPGPVEVFGVLWDELVDGTLLEATAITMQRAIIGFTAAIVIGTIVGALVSRSRVLRSAVGSLITGLQTMPSIAWFPLAILLFQLTEQAILFVVVIGAAPAIANGLIAGTETIPPLVLRSGKMLGASGFALYRHIILPAALPNYIGGMKQGWAFAWRSLMAGELLVIIASQKSIGSELALDRQLADAPGMIAIMIVILVIGIVVDSLFFGTLTRWVRTRYGLTDPDL